jgi:hypothetical protein
MLPHAFPPSTKTSIFIKRPKPTRSGAPSLARKKNGWPFAPLCPGGLNQPVPDPQSPFPGPSSPLPCCMFQCPRCGWGGAWALRVQSVCRAPSFLSFPTRAWAVNCFGVSPVWSLQAALRRAALCAALLVGAATVSAQPMPETQVLTFSSKPAGGSLQLYFTGEEGTPLTVNVLSTATGAAVVARGW